MWPWSMKDSIARLTDVAGVTSGRPSRATTCVKRERLKRFQGLLPESQDRILALTVLYVPNLFELMACWTDVAGVTSGRPSSATT